MTGANFQCGHPADLPVLNDQGSNKPLFIATDIGLHELLKHHMEQSLTGKVANVEGTGAPLTTKGSGAQFAFVIAVKGNAHVFHVDQGPTGGAAHNFYGVLVAQIIAALDCVIGVVFPVVAPVQEGRVYASLGGVGVAAHRMNFADYCGVGAIGPSGYCCPHPGQSRANYQDVVLQHIFSAFS